MEQSQDALCDGLRAAIVAALQEGGPALVAAATTELRGRVQAFLEDQEQQQEDDHGKPPATAAGVVVRAVARALGRGVGELREAYATARAERGGVDPTTGLPPGLALVRGLQCQALLRLQLGALVHTESGDPLPEKVVERARRYLADLQLRQTTTTLGAGEGKAGGGGGGATALEGAQWETVGGDEDGDDELLLSQESAKRGPAAEMDASFEAFLAKGVLAAFGRTHPKSCLALYAALECDPPAELLTLAGPDVDTKAAALDVKQQQQEEEQPTSTARRGPVFHLRAQEREQAQAMGFVSAYAEREAQRKQRAEPGVTEGKGKGELVVEAAAAPPPPQQQQQQQAKQQKRVLGRSASLPVTLGGGGGGSLLAQAAAAGGKRGGGSHYQVHVKTYRNPNILAQSRRPAPLARTASIAGAAAAAMPLQPLPGALNRSVSSVAALSSAAASLTLAAAAGPPSAAAAGIIKKRAPATASWADPGQRLLAKRMRPAAATTTTPAAASASAAAEPFPPGSPRASTGMGGFASPVGNKARRGALAASDTVLGTPPPAMSKHKGSGADEALVIAGTPDQPPARRRVGGGVFGPGTGRPH